MVSPVDALTLSICPATWRLDWAERWTLRVISSVEAPCSSTAAAIEVVCSETSLHDPGNLLDIGHGILGRTLDRADLPGDFLRRFRRLIRQILHLRRNDGEALAGLTGARRLDGGVEREQVGLLRDLLDQPDHVTDALRGVGQARHLRIGVDQRPAWRDRPPRWSCRRRGQSR